MITSRGAQEWKNIHVTETIQLADLIFIDNSNPTGAQLPSGFDLLKQTAQELEAVIQDARKQEMRIRALGSGWSLSDIGITDGWLINTKALNGCFEVSDKYFHDSYEKEKRPYLVVAQCGISMGELNVYLETVEQSGKHRALKTLGIGAGQTVVGAVSGNTHGAAINFGSTPDFIVGIQLVSGTGKSYWIERESNPVLNDQFTTKLGADIIRDDDVFNSALVSFGSFGVISAVAIETDPINHLKFQPVREVDRESLKNKIRDLSKIDHDSPGAPYHYELFFNPYDRKKTVLEASAIKVNYEQGHESPPPVWIVRYEHGFAPGDRTLRMLQSIPLPSKWAAAFTFNTYRERNILDDVRGTPGQLFTATVSYFEGNTESALGVSIDDAPEVLDIYSDVMKRVKMPTASQVRFVHRTEALLGFTCHAPKTVVFELGIAKNSPKFPRFENTLAEELRAAKINYTFHWSKNSGIDEERLLEMYGTDRVSRWRAARDRVFNNDNSLKKVFDNAHLERAGLT